MGRRGRPIVFTEVLVNNELYEDLQQNRVNHFVLKSNLLSGNCSTYFQLRSLLCNAAHKRPVELEVFGEMPAQAMNLFSSTKLMVTSKKLSTKTFLKPCRPSWC